MRRTEDAGAQSRRRSSEGRGWDRVVFGSLGFAAGALLLLGFRTLPMPPGLPSIGLLTPAVSAAPPPPGTAAAGVAPPAKVALTVETAPAVEATLPAEAEQDEQGESSEPHRRSEAAAGVPSTGSTPTPEGPGRYFVPESLATEPDPAAQAAPARQAPLMVSITANPWAAIEIDGKAVGETPLVNIPVSEGKHVFLARLPDGRVLSRTIEITPTNRRVAFR